MDYTGTAHEAARRLEVLKKQREVIDREIGALLQIIQAAHIVESTSASDRTSDTQVPEGQPLGFTDTVRIILEKSRTPLLPTEIREALESLGIEATSPKLLLIQVHNTLRRLYLGGEIEQIPRDGKISYRTLTQADRFARSVLQTPLGAVLSGLSNLPSAPKQNRTTASRRAIRKNS